MMNEDDKWIRKAILRFVGRILGAIVFLWLICYAVTFKPPREQRELPPPEEIWNGYDSSRPVTDISEIDYVNRRVTYHTYLKPGEKAPPLKIYGNQEGPSGGVVIKGGDGRAIYTGLTYEELFEQLNLEYEDLYEYYMD